MMDALGCDCQAYTGMLRAQPTVLGLVASEALDATRKARCSNGSGHWGGDASTSTYWAPSTRARRSPSASASTLASEARAERIEELLSAYDRPAEPDEQDED